MPTNILSALTATNFAVSAMLAVSLETNSHWNFINRDINSKELVDVVNERHDITYSGRGITNVAVKLIPYGSFTSTWTMQWRKVTNSFPPEIMPPTAPRGFFPPATNK